MSLVSRLAVTALHARFRVSPIVQKAALQQIWPLCSGRTFSSDVQREQMQYDVCIVGAGPAGLAAAIRLKQVGHAYT